MIATKEAAFVVNPAKCNGIETIKTAASFTPGWTTPRYFQTSIDEPPSRPAGCEAC